MSFGETKLTKESVAIEKKVINNKDRETGFYTDVVLDKTLAIISCQLMVFAVYTYRAGERSWP